MRRLGLSPFMLMPADPLVHIDATSAAGFDTVSLQLFPTRPHEPDVLSDSGLRSAILRRLDSTGLGVLDVGVLRAGHSLFDAPVEDGLAFAADLGAQWASITAVLAEDYDAAGGEAALISSVSRLCELAARRGVAVMLEFTAFRGLRTLQDARRVVEEISAPNLAITLDVLHFIRSGGTVADLVDLDQSLLAYAQLSDGPLQPPPDLAHESMYGRSYPGEGAFPLVEILSVLPADFPVSVEAAVHRDADLTVAERAVKSMRALRRVLDAAASARA